ncbi:MAG: right-handed parallel beta-helix repeat-containing protein [Pseudomonadota bacterium]
MTGSAITVDGITSHGVYGYAPPASFFDGTPPAADQPVYNVADYGAVADPSVDNRAAIQAAIDAAHEAGGGLVVLEAGVYGVAANPGGLGAVHLKSNVFLQGAGMGETSLRIVDGSTDKVTGIVRTLPHEATVNYGLADITLDGNRDNTSGKVDAYYSGGRPGGTITDQDAWVLRVEAANASGYGFDPHERTERLTIKDSVAHHNGLDGFVADYLIDSNYENNLAYANDRHGFNIVTSSNDMLLADNVARDNGGAGIVVQRGSEDIPSPENILIVGGEATGNARDGVLIQMSNNVEIRDVTITDNGTYGVRVFGSSQVSIIDNEILNNSRSDDGRFAGVQIREDEDFDVSGGVFEARDNLIEGNTIGWSEGLSGSYGIHEREGEVGGTVIRDNTFDGDMRDEVRLIEVPGGLDLSGGRGSDVLAGALGDDTISGNQGADTLSGDDGHDIISGDTGADTIDGGAGDDTLFGRDGDDVIAGGDGGDVISGGKGVDQISGGAGDDSISGNTGIDTIAGGEGDDTLRGNDGDDVVSGDAGADWIFGGKGRDVINGGDGDDEIKGDSNFDSLSGDAGDDRLIGGSGNDTLNGGSGDDALEGGSGTDYLTGGAGADTMTGNSGSDRFIFEAGSGHDTVLDFGNGNDRLDLRSYDFEAFTDVLAEASTHEEGDVVLNFAPGDSVTLKGVTLDDLSADDFFL